MVSRVRLERASSAATCLRTTSSSLKDMAEPLETGTDGNRESTDNDQKMQGSSSGHHEGPQLKPSPPPPRKASPPFDKASADLVLRTSDYVDFHVWKCILALASPVFEDMFELAEHGKRSEGKTAEGAECTSSTPSSASVIEVPETSSAWTLLLRWIYPSRPCHDPLPPFLLKTALAAAHKYQMDGVVSAIGVILVKNQVVWLPQQMYAIGARYGLTNIMNAAAHRFLTLSTSDANTYVEELEDISGGAYHRLCEYRRQCIATISEMTTGLDWLRDDVWCFKKTLVGCNCGTDSSNKHYRFRDSDVEHVLSAWFTGYYEQIGSRLKNTPSQRVLQDNALYEQALKEATKCSICREVVHNHIRLFRDALETEINERVEQVSLEIK